MVTIKTVLGSKIQLIDGDMGMSKWLLTHDGNQPREGVATQAVMDFIKPGMVCIDIGANIGYYALLAAKKGGFVHAIEPLPANIEVLKINIELNHYKNIKVYQLAIGSSEGKQEFLTSEHFNCGVIKTDILKDRPFIKSVMVDMMTLDNFCKEQNINKVDFIKMDVEGYEVEIIKGMRKTLEIMSKNSMLFIEIHPKAIKGRKPIFEMLDIVESYGFTIDTIQNPTIKIKSFEELKRSFNNIHCPRVVFRNKISS